LGRLVVLREGEVSGVVGAEDSDAEEEEEDADRAE
jgi:hypothetical protein